tara:strand:+ start:574 stop:1911 length:1338 start_codon:yes stop_codon:yes gene_type:complete
MSTSQNLPKTTNSSILDKITNMNNPNNVISNINNTKISNSSNSVANPFNNVGSKVTNPFNNVDNNTITNVGTNIKDASTISSELSTETSPVVNTVNNALKTTGNLVSNIGTTIKNTTGNVINKVNDSAKDLTNQIKDTSISATESVKLAFNDTKNDTVNLFSTNTYKESTSSFKDSVSDFLNTNNLVSRFAFVILILFIFIFLLRIGVNLIAYFLMPKDEPDLLKGMINSKQMMIIEQDPSKFSSIPLKRSVNRNDGIEFSWSVWINIEDITYNENKYRHIFNKGNSTIINDENDDNYGMIQPNNAPGLYITPYKNNLMVVMNTFNTINEKIEIEEIPLNKWLCIVIRCENKTLDIFINGTLVKRHVLSSVPKQNYDNVNLSLNGGFGGYTSSLKYYDRALNILDITSILYKGPNKKILSESITSTSKNPSYISTRWYFNENLNV